MIGRLEEKTLNKPGAMHQPLHGQGLKWLAAWQQKL